MPSESLASRIRVHPAAARLLVEGQQAFRGGDYSTALALADSAESFAPNLADASFLRGNVYAELSRVGQARAAYERALALDQNYRGAHLNLANLAFRQGELRQAIKQYQEEQERHPAAVTLVYMGRAYAKLGQADSARHAFQEAIALDEAHAPAYIQLSQLAEDLGELEGALNHAQKALSLSPESAGYRYAVGMLLLRTGRVDESIGYFETVIEQQPGHHGAYNNLGQALVRLGKRQLAQRYLNLADSLQQLQAQISTAEAQAEMAPDSLGSWLVLAQLHRLAGEYKEAESAYRTALYLHPCNLLIQNNLAGLALRQGRTQDAIQRYRYILQQDSSLADVWLNLGVVYASSGDTAQAKQAWEQVLRLEPEHAGARAFLARL